MNDPPDNQPHNAETVADTGPRGNLDRFEGGRQEFYVFLGRAGPVDVWADPADTVGVAFCYAYVNPTDNAHYYDSNWASDPDFIILRCRHDAVHLTLHDECIIHQLCAAHNTNHNGDTQ